MRTTLACVLCAFLAAGLALAADPQMVLGTARALPGGAIGAVAEQGSIQIDVEPSFVLEGVRHVANGVPFRNRATESLQLVGIPKGRKVVQALLYFNYSDGMTAGPQQMPILFDGAKVIGDLVAESADPCWMLARNHTYRFDVTDLVSQGDPNREYRITPPFDLDTVTSGENPWKTSATPKVNFEGATLIAMYESEEPSAVLIYDRLDESMFFTHASIRLHHPMLAPVEVEGLLTVTGADGQTGHGYDNAAAGEIGFLDQQQFSGPPASACDWDGSGRWPLSQLWDVHAHIVPIKGDASLVEYTGNGDCIVPVAFALEVPYATR